MERTLLNNWEAIELLTRLLTYSGLTGKTQSELENPEILFKFISEDNDWETIGAEIFAKYRSSKQKQKATALDNTSRKNGASFINELVISVKTRQPFVITEKKIGPVRSILNTNFPEHTVKGQVLIETRLDSTHNRFAGTKWKFYYQQWYDKANGSGGMGVNMATLDFKPYGKVIFDHFDSKYFDDSKKTPAETQQSSGFYRYEGYYSEYGNDKNILHLDLYGTVGVREDFDATGKHLEVLLFVGLKIPTIALGQWYGPQKSMHAANVVIQNWPHKGELLKPQLFTGNWKRDHTTMDNEIMDFFSLAKGQYSQRIKVPNGIFSLEMLRKHVEDLKTITGQNKPSK